MIKKTKILSAIFAASALVAACNSDDYEPAIITSENVEVSAFSLTADSKVLANLDSVFFSIDLVNAEIFNADSLPYGTRINKLIPKITTQSVSVAQLIVPRTGKADTTYNYLTNATDSIDFSNGPVRLRLVSQSGSVERTYQIKVNVHQVKSDSLEWGGAALAGLPGAAADATEARTVEFMGKYYTLSVSPAGYNMAVQDDPADARYSTFTPISPVNTPFGLKTGTLHATSDAAYMLAVDGQLLKSSDDRLVNWTATGTGAWHDIVATYADQVIGTRQDASGNWFLEYYPSGKIQTLPEGFPVSGTSQTISYRFEMSGGTNVLIVGGRTVTGLTSACWSYDGDSWAKLTRSTQMLPVEAPVVIPYFTTRTASDWVTNSYSTLVAFGGRNALGQIAREVYISYDFGVQWIKAGEVMQLPEYVPATAGAQAFVVDRELSVKSPALFGPARITRPITSWNCPYIYVYGGYDASGDLSHKLWRAVINRYTFKPVE